jgi:hypothetical protein
MDKGIQFEILYSDSDLLEFRVAAWNGQFGGTACVYVSIGALAEAAARLEGFPRDPSDIREIQFGVFGPNAAGGAVRMRFYCKDSAGHAVVEARVESGQSRPQEAFLFLSIEAAAVDTFVNDLRCLETDPSIVAFLRSSG